MTNGIFKSSEDIGYARALNVMSTHSPMDFEWSVKLIGGWDFSVGIASQLKREDLFIADYDPNAILYCSYRGTLSPEIQVGSHIIHRNLTNPEIGAIIRFRFQPHAKKLVIDLVRISNFQIVSLLDLTHDLRMDITK